MLYCFKTFGCLLFGICLWFGSITSLTSATAQESEDVESSQIAEVANERERDIPEIVDEPRFIDPSQFIPAELAVKATVDLRESSLKELAEWLRTEFGLIVLLEHEPLRDAGVLPSDPVSDWLDDDSIYFLLDRLQMQGLSWYYEDDVIFITTENLAEERMNTVPYHLGELLDAGLVANRIYNVVEETIAPTSWDDRGGAGRLDTIGDMLFVRQTDQVHRQIQGLLSALENHARQTFIGETAKDLALHQSLKSAVTAEFRDTPMDEALAELAQQANADIRFDMRAVRQVRFRTRQPVTLNIHERRLETVLKAMLSEWGLAVMVRHGVMWVTDQDTVSQNLKTAVYDVRDLCRDHAEAEALADAIQSQMPDVWIADGGDASLEFAAPGAMVVWAQDHTHTELLDLLEKYRFALRESKVRVREEEDVWVTHYYQLPANVADELEVLLTQLVAPDSWHSAEQPEAAGTILKVQAPYATHIVHTKPSIGDREEIRLLVARRVLIIHQQHSVHDQIARTIERIERGDPASRASTGGGGGYGGGGGGGFGGGFFSVPEIEY